ncbi:hypothetical protein FS749_002819 [Ceratobasidium sp. UAMH 11750]|nr:hypothetical protein FS749_002819 [Ceratobasidium sp. UAMH 11750]
MPQTSTSSSASALTPSPEFTPSPELAAAPSPTPASVSASTTVSTAARPSTLPYALSSISTSATAPVSASTTVPTAARPSTFAPLFASTPAPSTAPALLPYALSSVSASATAPVSAQVPLHSSIPAPSNPPPYTTTTTTTPASSTPAFANYQVLHHRTSPHEGRIVVMNTSVGGRWLFTSANDQGRGSFALSSTFDLTLDVVINTGDVWATAISWVSDKEFYIGFSDGRLYLGRLQLHDEDRVMKLTWVATVDSRDATADGELESPNAITAITFSKVTGYLAFSTSHNVAIFQRLDYNATSVVRGETNVGEKHRCIATLQPFAHTSPKINSLWLYGLPRVNLVVGGAAGLVVYSTYPNEPRIIGAMYDFQVSTCGVSPNGRILAASTPDRRLIHWPLTMAGPIFQQPSIITPLPQPFSWPPPCIPSISIMPTNVITGAMLDGQLCFAKPSTKERHLCWLDDRSLRVRAVAAYGDRFFVASTNAFNQSIEIVVYTSNRIDLELSVDLLRQPRTFTPRFNLLSELVDGPPGTVSDPSYARSAMAYLRPFSVLTVVVMLIAGLWDRCVAPITDLQIHNYVPSYLAAYANYVLAKVISAYQSIFYAP